MLIAVASCTSYVPENPDCTEWPENGVFNSARDANSAASSFELRRGVPVAVATVLGSEASLERLIHSGTVGDASSSGPVGLRVMTGVRG